MRSFTEKLHIFKAKTVTPGSPLTVDTNFPFGGLIRRLDLHLHLTLTQTTASTAVADALQGFIRNLVFRAGNSHFVKNCSGRALWYYAQLMSGTSLGITTWATTTATTYSLHLPIMFADDRMDWPNDTAIDARRHADTGFVFEMTPRTLDTTMLGTVGDATISVTADLTADIEMGQLAPVGSIGMPKGYRQYTQPAPIDPSSVTYFELEKNEKMFYRRAYIQASNSATAGAPFSGTPANTTLTSLSLVSNVRTHIDRVLEQNLRFENKLEYGLETALTGRYLLDFMKGKSNMEAISADPKVLSMLQLQVETNTLSTSQVSALFDTYMLF